MFALHLKFNNGDAAIKEKANNIVWLASKQVCDGTLDEDVRGYDYRHFGRAAIFLKDHLSDDTKKLFGVYTI